MGHEQQEPGPAARGGNHPRGVPQAASEPCARDENPPWDRDSVHLPIPAQPPESPESSRRAGARNREQDYSSWGYDPAAEASIPGMSFEDLTGTGKIAAVVPLQAGTSAWSAGVRAPRQGSQQDSQKDRPRMREATQDALEIDEQPSIQMRALRRGNLIRASAIVTAAVLFSKVLGLLRTSLLAASFDNLHTDAFTYAFTLPDAVFNIVAGGALASAFIPVFADYLIEKRDRRTAWYVASTAMTLGMSLLTIFAILGIIFAPLILNLTFHNLFIGPTCTGAQAQTTCAGLIVVRLTRIMLLQPIFLGGATVAVAILQARQTFLLPAAGQVIYSASVVGGILVADYDHRTHIFGGHLGIEGVAWGVVAGAFLQLVIQIPGLMHAKMRFRPSFDIFHPGVREIARLMLPRLLNASMLYVSVFINRFFLTLLDPSGTTGVAYGYTTAFTLVMLPTAIFGIAVSQAAFPTLAAYVAGGEWQRLRETILRTARGIIYLALPSSLGMMVLAVPLVKFIVAHGKFKLESLPLFTMPLIFFAIGLTGLSLVEILTRAFYVLHNTRTPTEVSIVQFLFSIGLSVMLLGPMGSSGLALASSLAWMGEALVLLLLLRPRLGGLDLKELGLFLLNVLAAAVVTALAALLVYMLSGLALPDVPTSTRETVSLGVRLVVSALAGIVAFIVASQFLGIEEVALVNRVIRRVLHR